MSEEQIKVIVIEHGAGFIKAGFSGEDRPCFPPSSVEEQKKPVRPPVRPLVIQPLKEPKSDIETTDQKNLKLENMETVWRDTFYNLNIDTSKSNSLVLLTVPPLTTNADKQIMTEIMFNKFNVSGLYIATDAVLALLATGRKTGIVLHSTEGATHIVPIYEGQAITDKIKRFNICGQDLTNYLMKLLKEKGYSFNSDLESYRSDVNDIKKKFCYVANNYLDEVTSFEIFNNSKNYEIRGESITINVERIICPELLFKPYIIASGSIGIHEVIYNSIIECDADIQKELFGNIILSGENTVFPGFAKRLEIEIREKRERDLIERKINTQDNQMEIKVHESFYKDGVNKQENLAWIGGSDLSSLDKFNEFWITKAEYDKSGSSIVNKKCI